MLVGYSSGGLQAAPSPRVENATPKPKKRHLPFGIAVIPRGSSAFGLFFRFFRVMTSLESPVHAGLAHGQEKSSRFARGGSC
jgi:hypothetical protein